MPKSIIRIDDALYDYLLSISLRESDIQQRLREETARMANSNMQIAPDQGQFMALLVKLIGARQVLEVGTFTGYSALSMALALPENGRLVACDLSEEWTNVGRRYWEEAGIADRISLRLGPAVDTLDALLKEGAAGSFDFAFIDADKVNYDSYYERSLKLVRPGGLIAIDNVLWSGDVIDPAKTDPDTEALRTLNAKLAADERVDISTLAIGDGLTLARSR